MELATYCQPFVYILITESNPHCLCAICFPNKALFLYHWCFISSLIFSAWEIALCWYRFFFPQNVLGQKDSRMDQWTWRSTFSSNIFEWQGKFIRTFQIPHNVVLLLVFLFFIVHANLPLFTNKRNFGGNRNLLYLCRVVNITDGVALQEPAIDKICCCSISYKTLITFTSLPTKIYFQLRHLGAQQFGKILFL